jgi:hypothetical protein
MFFGEWFHGTGTGTVPVPAPVKRHRGEPGAGTEFSTDVATP